MHKKVEANRIVPNAIGSSKKENLTIFKICIFPAIIAIAVYKYIPTSPNNFNSNRRLAKLRNKNKNHVLSIEAELNDLINPSNVDLQVCRRRSLAFDLIGISFHRYYPTNQDQKY